MNPAIPLFFGYARQLFGWYHPGHGALIRTCGIVLCQPLGHEYVCSHRAFRHLAERLAALGFAVLRFDYYGTGDSAGGSDEPALVFRWKQDIAAAIDELRAVASADHVSLVGLRVGGLLAAVAAEQRDDVDSLVLWSPCVTGKAYVRQTKMFAMTTSQHSDHTPIDGVDAAGFVMTSETVSALSPLSLMQLTHLSARRTLLMSRDDLTTDSELAAHLRARGVKVTEQSFSNYDTFMTSPVKSVLPENAIADVTRWLDETHPERIKRPDTHPAACAVRAETHLPSAPITERSVLLEGGLFGLLTTPEIRDPSKPAVVVLNTGGDHHIGPHRLYVPLARRWASMGFPVFRFDIAGLGESPVRQGNREGMAYPPGAIDDVGCVVRFLREECEFNDVVLVGVCSGAYYSVHAAGHGLPIAGNIAVNPPLYWKEGDSIDFDPYWNEVETNRVSRALLDRGKWWRLLRGEVDLRYNVKVMAGRAATVGRGIVSGARHAMSSEARDASDAEAGDVMALFPETVRTHLIFSGGDPAHLYLKRKIGRKLDTLLHRDNFSMEVVEGADHTFMPAHWQDALSELLTERLVQQFA